MHIIGAWSFTFSGMVALTPPRCDSWSYQVPGSRERSPISPDSDHLHRSDDFADTPREACGVVGVHLREEDAARVAYFGIYALQHRGQESAGIATGDGTQLRTRTAMGLINQALKRKTTSRTSPVTSQSPTLVTPPPAPIASSTLSRLSRAAPMWSWRWHTTAT